MALLTDPVNAEYDLDIVYIDGVMAFAGWDVDTGPSDYIIALLKRIHAEQGVPGHTWTWAIDNREIVSKGHVRYRLGPVQVDYVWVENPELL